MGFPQGDPILRTVLRWWGIDGVVSFLGWAQARDGFSVVAKSLADATAFPFRQSEMFPMWQGYDEVKLHRQTDEWQAIWGGGSDPHHLLHHAQIALSQWPKFDPNPIFLTALGDNAPNALIVDVYEGWYRLLIDFGKPASSAVDVIVKPIGWLGTFSRSPETGLWYRGEHSVHLMGAWT